MSVLSSIKRMWRKFSRFPVFLITLLDQASPRILSAYLFYTLILVFLSTHMNMIAGDSPPTVYLPVALLRWGTLRLDPLVGQIPVLFDLDNHPRYLVEVNGHYYSKYSPLPALLALPLYALYMAIGRPDYYVVYLTLSRVVSTFIAATTSVIVFWLLRLVLSQSRALFLTWVYALATFTWSLATNTLVTQGAGELFLAAGVLLLARAAHSTPSFKSFALAGFLIALAVASRPQIMAAALLLSLYVLQQEWPRPKIWLGFFGAAFPPAFLWGAYNLWAFGSPFATGYQQQALDGWSYPIWKGLLGILFSPAHGLWMYSPVLLIAFAGGWWVWRHDAEGSRQKAEDSRQKNEARPDLALLRTISLICLAQLLLISAWHFWNGGSAYNQRMLHEVAPLMFVLIAFAWRQWADQRWATCLLACAGLWGVWMNLNKIAFYAQHLSWVGEYRSELDWSLASAELLMYLRWHGLGGVLSATGLIALKVGLLILLLTLIMARFAYLRSRQTLKV